MENFAKPMEYHMILYSGVRRAVIGRSGRWQRRIILFHLSRGVDKLPPICGTLQLKAAKQLNFNTQPSIFYVCVINVCIN